MAEFINTIDALGDDAVVDSIIQGTITEFNDDQIKLLGVSALRNIAGLVSVKLPELTGHIGSPSNNETNWFSDCSKLENVDFPILQTIYGDNFINTKITKLCLPSLTTIIATAFRGMKNLVTIDLPVCTALGGGYSFYSCGALRNVILRNNVVCILPADSTFMTYVTSKYNPNIRIFVPAALLEAYKVATNWTVYADQLYALESYTVDGTITGELDETLI